MIVPFINDASGLETCKVRKGSGGLPRKVGNTEPWQLAAKVLHQAAEHGGRSCPHLGATSVALRQPSIIVVDRFSPARLVPIPCSLICILRCIFEMVSGNAHSIPANVSVVL